MINKCEPRAGVRERTQLINVAYRLLGSVVEAEDAVQETYARWHAMTREPVSYTHLTLPTILLV